MTVRGDPGEKLDYAFEVYDLDQNGYLGYFLNMFFYRGKIFWYNKYCINLDANELSLVLNGMLNMLSLNDVFDSNILADDIMKNLDSSHDQKISKGERFFLIDFFNSR